MDYVEAVVAELRSSRVFASHVLDLSTEDGGRAARLFFRAPTGWRRWDDAESAFLDWDEKRGWRIEIMEDTSHGFTYLRRGLGLDVFADPAVVASRVGLMFESTELPG